MYAADVISRHHFRDKILACFGLSTLHQDRSYTIVLILNPDICEKISALSVQH